MMLNVTLRGCSLLLRLIHWQSEPATHIVNNVSVFSINTALEIPERIDVNVTSPELPPLCSVSAQRTVRTFQLIKLKVSYILRVAVGQYISCI